MDASAQCMPLEDPLSVRCIENQDTIVFGYPTQFSNLPFMVRDFIVKNSSIWKGKKVFCINTLGLFSGDGTGCAARILKKYGAQILGGLQIKMPDSVCDSKLLKKSIEKNRSGEQREKHPGFLDRELDHAVSDRNTQKNAAGGGKGDVHTPGVAELPIREQCADDQTDHRGDQIDRPPAAITRV
jgi:hypothetical protein